MDMWHLEESPHLVIYSKEKLFTYFTIFILLRSDLRKLLLLCIFSKALEFSSLLPQFLKRSHQLSPPTLSLPLFLFVPGWSQGSALPRAASATARARVVGQATRGPGRRGRSRIGSEGGGRCGFRCNLGGVVLTLDLIFRLQNSYFQSINLS